MLYHYASIHGFKSILENRCFWMSQLSSMNDYMEHNWLKKIALERISELLKGPHRWSILDPQEKQLPNRLLTRLEIQLRSVPHVDPYAVCFSCDGDVLSQWRAYANDGKGFSIGFDPESLVFPNNTALVDVCYDSTEHLDIVNTLLNDAISGLDDEATDEEIERVADGLHGALLGPSMRCKNPKFAEEQEWRVVHEPILVDDPSSGKTLRVGPAEKSGFRIRGDELLHYLEVKFNDSFKESSVVEVVVGPKNPARVDLETLRLFLNESGYEHVKLRRSEATYR